MAPTQHPGIKVVLKKENTPLCRQLFFGYNGGYKSLIIPKVTSTNDMTSTNTINTNMTTIEQPAQEGYINYIEPVRQSTDPNQKPHPTRYYLFLK
jgi:hypothetical protein